MTEENPKPKLRIRKLTELKPNTAQEYQESMINRVDHFSQQRDSVFNSFVENSLVGGLKFLLDVKVRVDDVLGDNKHKVHDMVDKILLFGL